MRRKILLVLSFLLFTACLFDIDNKKMNEEVKITIEWPQESIGNTSNISDISRQLHPSTVTVDITLRNVITGTEYNITVSKGSSGLPSEVTIENVIIGQYLLIMDSYDSSGTLLARIEDDLSVGSGGTSYQGVFGKPDNIDTDLICPTNGEVVYNTTSMALEWYSVDSNYETSDATLDSITYEVYLGTSANLTEADKLTTGTLSSSSSGIFFSIDETTLIENGIEFTNGGVYYWKIVSTNSVGETTSNTWMFVYSTPIASVFTDAERQIFVDWIKNDHFAGHETDIDLQTSTLGSQLVTVATVTNEFTSDRTYLVGDTVSLVVTKVEDNYIIVYTVTSLGEVVEEVNSNNGIFNVYTNLTDLLYGKFNNNDEYLLVENMLRNYATTTFNLNIVSVTSEDIGFTYNWTKEGTGDYRTIWYNKLFDVYYAYVYDSTALQDLSNPIDRLMASSISELNTAVIGYLDNLETTIFTFTQAQQDAFDLATVTLVDTYSFIGTTQKVYTDTMLKISGEVAIPYYIGNTTFTQSDIYEYRIYMQGEYDVEFQENVIKYKLEVYKNQVLQETNTFYYLNDLIYYFESIMPILA